MVRSFSDAWSKIYMCFVHVTRSLCTSHGLCWYSLCFYAFVSKYFWHMVTVNPSWWPFVLWNDERSHSSPKYEESLQLRDRVSSDCIGVNWQVVRTSQSGSLQAAASFKLSCHKSFVWTGLNKRYSNGFFWYASLQSIIVFKMTKNKSMNKLFSVLLAQ